MCVRRALARQHTHYHNPIIYRRGHTTCVLCARCVRVLWVYSLSTPPSSAHLLICMRDHAICVVRVQYAIRCVFARAPGSAFASIISLLYPVPPLQSHTVSKCALAWCVQVRYISYRRSRTVCVQSAWCACSTPCAAGTGYLPRCRHVLLFYRHSRIVSALCAVHTVCVAGVGVLRYWRTHFHVITFYSLPPQWHHFCCSACAAATTCDELCSCTAYSPLHCHYITTCLHVSPRSGIVRALRAVRRVLRRVGVLRTPPPCHHPLIFYRRIRIVCAMRAVHRVVLGRVRVYCVHMYPPPCHHLRILVPTQSHHLLLCVPCAVCYAWRLRVLRTRHPATTISSSYHRSRSVCGHCAPYMYTCCVASEYCVLATLCHHFIIVYRRSRITCCAACRATCVACVVSACVAYSPPRHHPFYSRTVAVAPCVGSACRTCTLCVVWRPSTAYSPL